MLLLPSTALANFCAAKLTSLVAFEQLKMPKVVGPWLAFAAVKPGTPCEAVDAAARKVITDAGFGPDYKVPGLPHRTGHGIGLDGHEWTNFVRGNKTPLAPGMCFSNEPMVAIYGEFGIRLEDCLYVTDSGARYFSQSSPSIDKPFA